MAIEKPFVVLVVHAAHYRGTNGVDPALFESAAKKAADRVQHLSKEAKR